MFRRRADRDIIADSYFDPTLSEWQVVTPADSQGEGKVLIPLTHLLGGTEERLDLMDPKLAVEKVREAARTVNQEIFPTSLELVETASQRKRMRERDTLCTNGRDTAILDVGADITGENEQLGRMGESGVTSDEPNRTGFTRVKREMDHDGEFHHLSNADDLVGEDGEEQDGDVEHETTEGADTAETCAEGVRIVFFDEDPEEAERVRSALMPQALPIPDDDNVDTEVGDGSSMQEAKHTEQAATLTTADLSNLTAADFLKLVRKEAKHLPKVLKAPTKQDTAETNKQTMERLAGASDRAQRRGCADGLSGKYGFVKDVISSYNKSNDATKRYEISISRRREIAEEAADIASLVKRYQAKLSPLPQSSRFSVPKAAERCRVYGELNAAGISLTEARDPLVYKRLWGYLGWVLSVRKLWEEFDKQVTANPDAHDKLEKPRFNRPTFPADDPNPYQHVVYPSCTYIEIHSDENADELDLLFDELLARIRAVPLPPQPKLIANGPLVPHLSPAYVAAMGWGLRYSLENEDADSDNEEEYESNLADAAAAAASSRAAPGEALDSTDESACYQNHYDESESQMYEAEFLTNIETWLDWAVPKFPVSEEAFAELYRLRSECLLYTLGVITPRKAQQPQPHAAQAILQTLGEAKQANVEAQRDVAEQDGEDEDREVADTHEKSGHEGYDETDGMDQSEEDDMGINRLDIPMQGEAQSAPLDVDTPCELETDALSGVTDPVQIAQTSGSLLKRVVNTLTQNAQFRSDQARSHSVPPYLCQLGRLDATAKRALLIHLLSHVEYSYRHQEEEETSAPLYALSPLHVEWLFVMLILVEKPIDADVSSELLRVSRRLIALRSAAAQRLESWQSGLLVPQQVATLDGIETWLPGASGSSSMSCLEPARRPMSRYGIVLTTLRREIEELKAKIREQPRRADPSSVEVKTEAADGSTVVTANLTDPQPGEAPDPLQSKKSELLRMLAGSAEERCHEEQSSMTEEKEYQAYQHALSMRVPRPCIGSMADVSEDLEKGAPQDLSDAQHVSSQQLTSEQILAIREAEYAALEKWTEDPIPESTVVSYCSELLAVIEGRFGQVDKSCRTLDGAYAVQRAINRLSLK